MRETSNMRSGFTMIELIFVIVIIGILAAVAIPKMAETSKSAKQSNLESFIATLNGTVGPTMWNKALRNDSGKIATTECANYANYIQELPKEVTAFNADCSIDVDPAIANTGVVSFSDGDTVQGPVWTLDKTKYK